MADQAHSLDDTRRLLRAMQVAAAQRLRDGQRVGIGDARALLELEERLHRLERRRRPAPAPLDQPTPERCTARTKAGRPCGNRPIPGGTVCRFHGGGAPQVRAIAARRLAVEDAHREVRRLGLALDADPLDVLLDQVREAAGNVAAYRLAVEGLRIDVGAGGVAGEIGDHGLAEANVLVRMYDAERDRLTRYAKMCLDAGVDERRVRVAEGDAQRLATAVGRALDRVGLSEEQRGLLRAAMAEELRALRGEPAA